MTVSMTIVGDDENDFRRQFCRIAASLMADYALDGFNDPEPEATEPPAATTAAPDPVPETPKKGGRPRGSTNKPKSNGSGAEPAQTEAQLGEVVELMPLAEQIQIITDAAHDHPDKFKPLLVPLREKLGVQYVSKALEKDRFTLQEFIHQHGLAV